MPLAFVVFSYLLAVIPVLTHAAETCSDGTNRLNPSEPCIPTALFNYLYCLQKSGGGNLEVHTKTLSNNKTALEIGVKGSASGVIIKGDAGTTYSKSDLAVAASEIEAKLDPTLVKTCKDLADDLKRPAALVPAPIYETRWEKVDAEGRAIIEDFGPIHTENRHNRNDIIALGTFQLQRSVGRIFSVGYACVGYPCGWSYNPDGGYSAKVQISGDGRSFRWFRKWDGDPAVETYQAHVEVPKMVCVRNC